MRYLLDTHIIIWLLEDNDKLSQDVKDIILDDDNKIFYSTASVWETSIKKMSRPKDINITGSKMSELCKASGFVMLPISDRHINSLEMLNENKEFPEHKDPFDRILLSQAKTEDMLLITHDAKIAGYGEKCVVKV